MLQSMTGFGRYTAENSRHKFTVEIKSLNSKQLDLISRIPSAYREMELPMRNIIAAAMQRGKVDLALTSETIADTNTPVLNLERLQVYKDQIRQMAETLSLPEPADWYSVLLRMPEVYYTDNTEEASDDDRDSIIAALEGAVAALNEFRSKEGAKLEEFFRQRIANIGALLAQIPDYETERITKIKTRIEDTLAQIPNFEYDRGRLEQEMIFYIEKLDISEEKQRLSQHLAYFLETLDAAPGQGKKLGFISQEMGREINTLGSKSNQADMQIIVVKMKDELEQIKEQVLNVL